MAIATATDTQVQHLAMQGAATDGVIVSRVHARIGFLGNPSDGYYGKTISFALANFYAEVCVCCAGLLCFTYTTRLAHHLLWSIRMPYLWLHTGHIDTGTNSLLPAAPGA